MDLRLLVDCGLWAVGIEVYADDIPEHHEVDRTDPLERKLEFQ